MTSAESSQAPVATGRLDGPVAVRWLLVVGVVAVSFAGVLIRSAAAPALALAFWRSFGGAVALAPFAARAAARPDRAERRALLASGVCLAVHFALFIGAFAYTSVASAVVFATTSPVFVGLGSWVFLGQPPSRRTWAGIGVAMVGAVVVALGDLGSDGGSNPLLGDLMSLAGAVAVSGYLLLGQRSRSRLTVSTYGTWVYGTSAVVLLVASVIAGSPVVGFSMGTWLAILGLIVGPQLLGHTTFNHAMGVVPATTIAVIVLSEPIGAGLLAFWLLGELPPPLLAVGGPLILAGVFMAALGQREPVGTLDPAP
jgi:drug/metabolite transporter (DMT)-like permease